MGPFLFTVCINQKPQLLPCLTDFKNYARLSIDNRYIISAGSVRSWGQRTHGLNTFAPTGNQMVKGGNKTQPVESGETGLLDSSRNA
jgi:hypothetical protein